MFEIEEILCESMGRLRVKFWEWVWVGCCLLWSQLVSLPLYFPYMITASPLSLPPASFQAGHMARPKCGDASGMHT